MSGIFGIFNTDNINEKNIDISPLSKWNSFYGEEKGDIFTRQHISLGCFIKSFSDDHLQKTSVIEEKDSHAVIDALLYNRDELIKKCGVPNSTSDAKLLLDCIEKFGIDILQEVNGDFSGAIYNGKENTLLLFRDHMGIRPLYYYHSEDIVVFSTDLRGITALPIVDASISEDWISDTLLGYSNYTLDDTPYKNINLVSPASYMMFSIKDNKIHVLTQKYWKLGSKKIHLSSDTEYQKKLKELITDSVNRRLNAVSGLVGAELSGGLDSSLIDILINRSGREGIYLSWSYNPSDYPYVKNDERVVISDICEQENIKCNYLGVGGKEIPDITKRFSDFGMSVSINEPEYFRFAFPFYANTYALHNSALYVKEKGAKVMFTGHGGDEGVSHRCAPYEMYHHHEYLHYLMHFWNSTKGRKLRISRTLVRSCRYIKYYYEATHTIYRNHPACTDFINPDFSYSHTAEDPYILEFGYDPISYIENGGSRNRLENIALVEANTGIRYIVPYLDYRVIDFAVSIPRYLYLNGDTNRYIFREAFKDIMPNSLYSMFSKADYSFTSAPEDPDYYKKIAQQKTEIVKKLNRNFWTKYLNFNEVDKYASSGIPTEDVIDDEIDKIQPLDQLALAQNMVEKSREYTATK